MEKKKIEGILKKSNEVRNELLSKKIDRNPQYLGEYNTLFGEEFSVAEKLEMPLMNGLNLYDYYHSEDSMLGSALNKVYFPDGMEPEKTYLDDVKELNLYNYTHEEDSRYKDMISDRYFPEGIVPVNDYLQSVKENNLYNFTHEENSTYKDYIKEKYFDKGVNANEEYGKYINDGELYRLTHSANTNYSNEINHKYFFGREYYDDRFAELFDFTHSADTDYSRFINGTYVSGKEPYEADDAYMMEYTHSADTTYVDEINKTYFDNRETYSDTDASLLEDTHSAKTEYVKKINNQYVDNKGFYDANDASLLEDTHSANTEYSEKIDNQYIDNKGNYSEFDASLLEDTHSANTEYVTNINNKYIDNKGYYDVDDASLLEDTHSAKTEYSENINHQYVDSKVEYRNNDDLLNYTLGENLESETSKVRKNVRGNKAKTQSENDKYAEEIFNKYFNFGRAIKVESVGDGNHKNWQGEYGYDNAKLLEDTHSANTEYSENINRTYGNWNQNYIQYLDEVLGMDAYSRHVDYINNLLAGHYITNALREVEVGVIRNYSVGAAMAGLNTTNQNNMSGKDTTLGTITNYMYSHSLYYGAIFNSDRKSNEKYLTPNLFNWYGNNLSNVYELSDIAKIGANDYRLAEDPGAEVKIIHDFSDNISANQLNLRYLTEAIDKGEEYYTKERPKAKHTKIGTDSYFGITWNEDSGTTVTINDKQYSVNSDIYNQNPTLGVYIDSEKCSTYENHNGEYNGEDESYKQITVNSKYNSSSILNKTQLLFDEHKIGTMIGRFCSMDGEKDFGIVDTARSKLYGNAHGRNLMTKEAQDNNPAITNGYINPYCRDWTVFNQYSKVKNLIRPFMNSDGEFKTIADVQSVMGKYRSNDKRTYIDYESDENGKVQAVTKELQLEGDGGQRLADYTVLNNNGFVNIAPSKEGDDYSVEIKKCMFSIENLAWKDVTIKEQNDAMISKEQIGPNGGRIMWFPPYGLNFQENVQVNWNDNTFIGRGEKVYTYTDTVRTGSLSFYLLIDHPSIINSMAKLNNGYADIKDADAEILRFFAGCSIPEVPEDKDKTPETPEKTPEEKKVNGEIKFYTYFPNNYSGSISQRVDASDVHIQNYDWWEYLLIGNNTTILKDDETYWVGYEMTDKGLTQTYSDKTIQDELQDGWMPVTINCNQVLGDESQLVEEKEADKTTGKYCYKYRVDFDRTQKLDKNNPNKAFSDNYKDTKSLCLNSKFNADIHKDADYTFSEFIYAMLKTENLITQVVDDDKLIEYLEKDENGLIRKDVCEKLISKIEDESFKINEIKVDGSATQRDSGFSKMLAIRRASSLRNMFIDNYTYQGDISISGDISSFDEGQEASNNISSDADKEQRCVLTTIKYEIAATQALSDSDAKATNEETATEKLEKEKMFSEWYQVLIAKSEIMKIFQDSLPEGDFSKELKTYMDKNDISYNKKDYTDDSTWIYMITDYVTDEQKDAEHLYPSYCMVDSDFMEKITGQTPPTQSEIADSGKTEDIKKELDDENTESNNKIISLTADAGTLGVRINLNKNKVKTLQADVDTKTKEVEQNKSTIDADNARISELQNQLEHWPTGEEGKKEIQEEQKRLKEEIESLNKKNATLDTEIKSIKSDIDKTQEQIDKDTQELEKINKLIDAENTKIAENTKKISEMPTFYEVPFEKVVMFYDSKHRYDSEFSLENYIYESVKDGYWKYNDESIDDCGIPVKVYDETVYTEDTHNLSFNYIKRDYLVVNKLVDEKEENYYYTTMACVKDMDKFALFSELLYVNDIVSRVYNSGDEGRMKDVFENCLNKYLSTTKITNSAYKNAVEGVVKSGYARDVMEQACDDIVTYTDSYANEIFTEIQNSGAKEKQAAKENKEKYDKETQELIAKALVEQKEKEKNDILYAIYGRGKSTRYETEAEYFKKLDKESPLIFKSIKEKFKYFNPAFHSMSPEGFNARLNFLHQCTRQGSTYEPVSGNGGARPAGNLAFGRMPICVLRIGDFIKTRVIVNSVNIDYNVNGDVQWDLNPEGIGVQPMYAKITLNVTLLGGQSLSGPINRLQNAVSFNYYANTEVYDDRADIGGEGDSYVYINKQ